MTPTATSVCGACNGRGVDPRNRYTNPISGKTTGHLKLCESCFGQGIYFEGVEFPSHIPPGEDKVAILAARYRKGIHLWNDGDVGVEPEPFDNAYIPTGDMAAAVVVEKQSTRTPRREL
jgi:hypothetical protein